MLMVQVRLSPTHELSWYKDIW